MIIELLLMTQTVTVSELKVVKEEVVEQWEAVKRTDPITDERSCFVMPSFNAKTRPEMAAILGTGFAYITTGNDVYPGSDAAVRVDSNKPFFWNSDGGPKSRNHITAQVISQLRKPGKHNVTVKWIGWPSRAPFTETFDAGNFVQAWDECKAWIR